MIKPDSTLLSLCCIISMGQYFRFYQSNLEDVQGVCVRVRMCVCWCACAPCSAHGASCSSAAELQQVCSATVCPEEKLQLRLMEAFLLQEEQTPLDVRRRKEEIFRSDGVCQVNRIHGSPECGSSYGCVCVCVCRDWLPPGATGDEGFTLGLRSPVRAPCVACLWISLFLLRFSPSLVSFIFPIQPQEEEEEEGVGGSRPHLAVNPSPGRDLRGVYSPGSSPWRQSLASAAVEWKQVGGSDREESRT